MSRKNLPRSAGPSENDLPLSADILIGSDGKVTFVSLFRELLPVASALDPEIVNLLRLADHGEEPR